MKRICIILIVLALAVSCFACGKDEKKKEPVITDVPAAPTENPTEEIKDEPTEVPTEEPTEVPEPTPNPRNCTVIEKMPDYYLDFTYDGTDAAYVGFYTDLTVSEDENGIIISCTDGARDPLVNISMPYSGDDGIDPTEYKYFAIRFKTSIRDGEFQLRYGTESDDRGWAMCKSNYADTDGWQSIAVELTKAEFTNANTLDGSSILFIRIDPIDAQDSSARALTTDDFMLIESCAFFKTAEEANAFAGLYIYNE